MMPHAHAHECTRTRECAVCTGISTVSYVHVAPCRNLQCVRCERLAAAGGRRGTICCHRCYYCNYYSYCYNHYTTTATSTSITITVPLLGIDARVCSPLWLSGREAPSQEGVDSGEERAGNSLDAQKREGHGRPASVILEGIPGGRPNGHRRCCADRLIGQASSGHACLHTYLRGRHTHTCDRDPRHDKIHAEDPLPG